MKVKSAENEIKWLDFVVQAVGGKEWKSIFEVRERMDEILPPHAIYRKKPQYNKAKCNNRTTIHSLKLTIVGSSIRYATRNGFVERSVSIESEYPRNIGNYYVRLTPLGLQRLKRFRRYVCNDCLNTGTTRAIKPSNATCGHCNSRNLRFY